MRILGWHDLEASRAVFGFLEIAAVIWLAVVGVFVALEYFGKAGTVWKRRFKVWGEISLLFAVCSQLAMNIYGSHVDALNTAREQQMVEQINAESNRLVQAESQIISQSNALASPRIAPLGKK
jgi:hypothetical protein